LNFQSADLGGIGPNGEPVIECYFNLNLDGGAMSNSYKQFWQQFSTGSQLSGRTFKSTWLIKGESGKRIRAWLDIPGSIGTYRDFVLTGDWQEINMSHLFPSTTGTVIAMRIGTRDLATTPAESLQIARGSLSETMSPESPLPPYYATTSARYYGPRFEHTPVTGVSKGILLERESTNLILQSRTLESGGQFTLSGATAAYLREPWPLYDRILHLKEDSTAAVHALTYGAGIAVTGGIQYCFSFYYKQAP
jgi:hypothetical protein